ncbi:MAG: hypothetical protein ACI9PP_000745 [Halobacteriales archaeon]|jgi:hypothetical protein
MIDPGTAVAPNPSWAPNNGGGKDCSKGIRNGDGEPDGPHVNSRFCGISIPERCFEP